MTPHTPESRRPPTAEADAFLILAMLTFCILPLNHEPQHAHWGQLYRIGQQVNDRVRSGLWVSDVSSWIRQCSHINRLSGFWKTSGWHPMCPKSTGREAGLVGIVFMLGLHAGLLHWLRWPFLPNLTHGRTSSPVPTCCSPGSMPKSCGGRETELPTNENWTKGKEVLSTGASQRGRDATIYPLYGLSSYKE